MIVNDCIDLKTRIIDVKNINKKQFVVIQNGIYTGFLDKIIFNKKYEMMLLMNENNFEIRYKKDKICNHGFYLFGGSSDTLDFLGKYYINKRASKNLIIGQNVLVKNVGAYFEEVFTSYCNNLVVKYTEV